MIKELLIAGVVVVLVVVGLFLRKQKSAVAPIPVVSVTTNPSVSPNPKPQTVTIVFANNIATPNAVNIRVGDIVKFINNDAALHWPASGPHPTHTICPGFDYLRGLKTSESYSFTFDTAKTCPWHDHLQPSINGQIIISP